MSADYQLIIRGGTVVDGSGGKAVAADVAIQDGLIVKVGQIHGTAEEEIDASGLIVTPGFVDVHTHYDGQITWESRMAPSSNHGVTTVVMGNCGVGFAPCRKGDEDLMIRLMEGVEDIPHVVMAAGVPFNWTSFPDYLDALEQRQSDVDFATQIPHSPLRVFVMGERGADLEPANEQDLGHMRRLVAEAIQAGALGVSTSRNLFHRFRNGKLAPSVRSELAELKALAAGLKDAGDGVFQCIPDIDGNGTDEVGMLEAIAQECGRPVNFSLIPMPGNPANWDIYVNAIRTAQDKGLRLNGQFLPRAMGVLFGLDLSFHPFSLNPSYRALADLPLAEKVGKMRDPALRARLLSEEPEDPNPAFVGLLKAGLTLYRLGEPANYDFAEEESLQAEAARSGRPLADVIYDALLESEGRAILCAYGSNVRDTVERTSALIGEDNMIVALGDGGAHYAMICDAAYPTYMLANRLGREGLDLPRLVRSLTSQPAESVGLLDRGRIAPGYKADINILDPEKIVLHRPQIQADLPAGGKRLRQEAQGYVATLVSGSVTYRDGIHTGALPGKLVRGTRSAPTDAHIPMGAAA
ncbi:N-acyl-D-amino-acid deacylase family protein [Sphingobium sp. LMC3-1-1.1]|uniref:N-acyl-D-amino-acid deacylase family protein n=1 Tax=unclassified Sphingobium TaxID=2611147 RepID=UPI00343840DE